MDWGRMSLREIHENHPHKGEIGELVDLFAAILFLVSVLGVLIWFSRC